MSALPLLATAKADFAKGHVCFALGNGQGQTFSLKILSGGLCPFTPTNWGYARGGGSTRYRDAPPGPTPSLPAQRIAKVVECSGDRRVRH